MEKFYTWFTEHTVGLNLDEIIEENKLTADSSDDEIYNSVHAELEWYDDRIYYAVTDELYEKIINDIRKRLTKLNNFPKN